MWWQCGWRMEYERCECGHAHKQIKRKPNIKWMEKLLAECQMYAKENELSNDATIKRESRTKT